MLYIMNQHLLLQVVPTRRSQNLVCELCYCYAFHHTTPNHLCRTWHHSKSIKWLWKICSWVYCSYCCSWDYCSYFYTIFLCEFGFLNNHNRSSTYFNWVIGVLTNLRSSHSWVFLTKLVLKICSKFTGEHPCRSVISIKLQSNFIEIILRHRCSPVNLLDICRTPTLKNMSEELLLWLKMIDVVYNL